MVGAIVSKADIYIFEGIVLLAAPQAQLYIFDNTERVIIISDGNFIQGRIK